jgi:hypothetical protein
MDFAMDDATLHTVINENHISDKMQRRMGTSDAKKLSSKYSIFSSFT